MGPILSIAKNTLIELLRQPVFLLLTTASGFFNIFLASIYYFGFGDDPNMVKNMVLATSLIVGLITAVLSASAAVNQEIEKGTALTVLSKRVSRFQFLIGKYLGLIGLLTIITYFNSITVLLASRMAFDVYDTTDYQSLIAFSVAVITAYFLGAFMNYFLDRSFPATTMMIMLFTVTVAFIIIAFYLKLERSFGKVAQVDWRLIPICMILMMCIWVLAAVALAASTRLNLIAALSLCSVIFILGLMSDYLFGRLAEAGVWWANIIYGLLPNWQLFWMGDTIAMNKQVSWSYVLRICGYTLSYSVACLGIGLLLFEDREMR